MVERRDHRRDERPPKGPLTRYYFGADDEIRTRDPHLGQIAKAAKLGISGSFRSILRPNRPPRPPQSAQNVERSTIANSALPLLRLATDQQTSALQDCPTTIRCRCDTDDRDLDGGRRSLALDGETVHHWSNVLTSELDTLFDPVEVWLFGSVARGDDGADSDLDVMIVLDHYDTADAIDMKRRATVSTTTPAPFDVAFSDPDRMVQRAGVVGTIERAVRLDGVLKYRRG
jgi:predicted nucleotidyltransferase